MEGGESAATGGPWPTVGKVRFSIGPAEGRERDEKTIIGFGEDWVYPHAVRPMSTIEE